MELTKLGIETTVQGPFENIVERTRAALADNGFGILTEIDTQATLKKKLGVDSPKRIILGACNPPLAHRALELEPSVSLLMPCNVVVTEVDKGVKVSAMNPGLMGEMLQNEELTKVAEEAVGKLQAAIERIENE